MTSVAKTRSNWQSANGSADVARLNRSEALFGAKPDRLGVEVDALHTRKAEIAQQAQIGAGAAAEIENCGIGR